MCTVTFWPRRGGYRLAMNRDEQWTRPISLPPSPSSTGDPNLLAPSEPGGGTWIGIRNDGAAFALVNWYSRPFSPSGAVASRGQVVPLLLARGGSDGTPAELELLCRRGLRPFRVIGFFPRVAGLREWRWDGSSLSEESLPWEPRQWISSGKDESTALRIRGMEFERRRQDSRAGTLRWLRSLHGSHTPERGAFSHCVHREDAGTVSYTEITANRRRAALFYRPGCPCLGTPGTWNRLPLRSTAFA